MSSTQYYVLNDSQVADTAALSIISDALLRVLEKAKYEYEVALLEKAVKEASATGCIGSCSLSSFFGIYFSLCF
jgi:hypothetical protein